jgi:hypothetical protein
VLPSIPEKFVWSLSTYFGVNLIVQVEIAKKRKTLEERNAKRRAAGASEIVPKRPPGDADENLEVIPEPGASFLVLLERLHMLMQSF